jgi:glycosyltransferase involved in cell wall biosynthesis
MVSFVYFTTNRGTQRSVNNAMALGAYCKHSSIKYTGYLLLKPFYYSIGLLSDIWFFAHRNISFVILEVGGSNFSTLILFLFVSIILKIKGVSYAIDSHSSASNSYIDNKSALLKFIYCRSKFVILHNYLYVDSFMHFKTFVLYSRIPDLLSMPVTNVEDAHDIENCKASKSVVFITKFHDDEPIDTMLKSTAFFDKSFSFYFTGDHLLTDYASESPQNVSFTGFLPYESFKQLLIKSSAIVAMTIRDKTLLYAGREALALRKPLVLSDNPINQFYYRNTALYASNDPFDLSEKIKSAIKLDKTAYIKTVDKLVEFHVNEYDKTINNIINHINKIV